jgi:MFS family permease
LALTSVFGGAGRALENPVYRTYWFGHTLAAVGRWMKRTAVGWLTWELTQSPNWLGIVAAADLVPMVLFSILAGAIADRVGLMRIVKLSQILAGSVAAIFSALILTELITIEAILVLSVFFGASEALGQPARMAAVHAMVKREDLPSAIALGAAAFNASRIVGPAIAGGLILWTNTGFVLALCALIFLVFYLLLRSIHIAETATGQSLSLELFVDIWRGFIYVFEHPGIRFLILLMFATSFLIRPVIELMPGVSGEVFGKGAAGLSLLLSAIGVGALGASLWLARRGQMAGLTGMVVLSTLGTGLALIIVMLVDSIWLAAFFLAVVGAYMLAGNVSAQSLIQNTVDPGVRARVLGLYIVVAHGFPALGAVIMGAIATHAGLRATIASGAAIMILVWIWSRTRRDRMARNLERGEAGGSPA